VPTLDEHQSTKAIKLLLIGDSGSGKTGSLASLINQGYKVRALDFDNGLDALARFVTKDKLKNVIYHTLQDKLKFQGTTIGPDGSPTAWVRAAQLLTEDWKDSEGKSVGSLQTWGPDTIFLVDSMTFMGDCILRFIRALAGNTGNTTQPQWGEAMRKLEEMLQILWSDLIKCHVIVTSHITFIADEGEGNLRKGYPTALGSKLPPKIPRYFNSVLQCVTLGSGTSERRVLRTKSTSVLELKNPSPLTVPVELDISNGLAEYFRLVLAPRT